MGSSKKSGGCLKNIILTAIIVGGIAYIKDGGLDDLLSSFSYEDSYHNYDTHAYDTHVYDTYDTNIPSVNTTVNVTTSQPPILPQVTEAPELKNVPSELRENVYLDYIGGGYCEKLSGNIEINVIFVTDNDSKWDQASKSKAVTEIQEQQALISNTAASFGITANISVRYHEGKLIGQSITSDNVDLNWKSSVLNSAGLGDASTAQTNIESSRGVSSAPLVFLFNTSGRATASHQSTGRVGVESIMLYSNGISSLFHEMCHLYGAKDFYYPNDVESLAKKYLPESIMNDGETVDPLTAFIIGWTDTLSPSAESFLRETSYITNEYLNEKHKVETFTGYVESFEYSDGLYTGYLNNGWPDGQGTHKMNNGTYQSGTWDNGRFLNGECIIYYKNGAVFKGNKVNGEISGYGVYTYSDGTKEEGYYVNGEINGQCVIYYNNGTVFKGNKVNGEISGYGETTYSDGGWYKGNWENGKRNGYGEMKYTDGGIYKGNWVDGSREGQGTMYYSSGTVYTGNWSGNTANGQGTMNYKNGDSYTGGWKNGKRHGYGTYTWASGSVKSGNWSNGEFVG